MPSRSLREAPSDGPPIARPDAGSVGAIDAALERGSTALLACISDRTEGDRDRGARWD